MKTFALSSGSTANCFYLETGKNKILIDLGLSYKRTQEILKQKNINITHITSIFITHEHTDHVNTNFIKFFKELNAKIYLSQGTYDILEKKEPKIQKYKNKITIIKNHSIIKLENLKIFAIEKPHDAAEPLSFIFEAKNKKIGFFTDLGHVTNEILHFLKTLDIIYIETNYCRETIKTNKDLNQNYISRLLSNNAHLNIEQTCDLLKEIADNNKILILSHISENTNSYENVYLKIKQYLQKLNLSPKIYVSFQEEPTPWIE